jgi:hypothetical protein
MLRAFGRGSTSVPSKNPRRDTDIIRRFVAGEVTKQIAHLYGISGERVYQIVKLYAGLNRRKIKAMKNGE